MDNTNRCPVCGQIVIDGVCPICDSGDIPPYRKKAGNKGLRRSKHKHQYEPCLLELYELSPTGKPEDIPIIFKSYCRCCGKIGDVDVARWYNPPKRNFLWPSGYTEEALKELDPKTRTIPLFRVEGYFDKFVNLSIEAAKDKDIG